MPGTRIVVADRTRARFFKLLSPAGAIEETGGFEDDTARKPSRALVTDKAGRRTGTPNGGTSDAARVDPQRQAAQDFARRIVKELEADANRNVFDALIVVAEPRFLGFLRETMPARVSGLVQHEVHKDLAQARLDEIERYMRAATAEIRDKTR